MKFSKKITKKWQEVWTTGSGEEIKVCDMTEDHAKNCLNLLLKRIREREENIEQQFKRDLNEELNGVYGMGMDDWWKG